MLRIKVWITNYLLRELNAYWAVGKRGRRAFEISKSISNVVTLHLKNVKRNIFYYTSYKI